MGGRIGENRWSDIAIFDGRIQRESVVAFGEITHTPNTRCWYYSKVEKGASQFDAFKSASPLLKREIPDAEVERQIKIRTAGLAATSGALAAIIWGCPAIAPTVFTPVGAGLFITCNILAGLVGSQAGARAARNGTAAARISVQDAAVAAVPTQVEVPQVAIMELRKAVLESSGKQTGNSCWSAEKVIKSLVQYPAKARTCRDVFEDNKNLTKCCRQWTPNETDCVYR